MNELLIEDERIRQLKRIAQKSGLDVDWRTYYREAVRTGIIDSFLSLEDRCSRIEEIFKDLGFSSMMGAYDRKGCAQPVAPVGYIFYPLSNLNQPGLGLADQMFRAYVHESRDLILLRRNIAPPGSVSRPRTKEDALPSSIANNQYILGATPFEVCIHDEEAIAQFIRRYSPVRPA